MERFKKYIDPGGLRIREDKNLLSVPAGTGYLPPCTCCRVPGVLAGYSGQVSCTCCRVLAAVCRVPGVLAWYWVFWPSALGKCRAKKEVRK